MLTAITIIGVIVANLIAVAVVLITIRIHLREAEKGGYV